RDRHIVEGEVPGSWGRDRLPFFRFRNWGRPGLPAPCPPCGAVRQSSPCGPERSPNSRRDGDESRGLDVEAVQGPSDHPTFVPEALRRAIAFFQLQTAARE